VQRTPGVLLYALATIATGINDLVFGKFDPAEEPIQAWGDYRPWEHPFAVTVAIVLILAGIGLLNRRTQHFAAVALVGTYLVLAAFPLPRFVTAPPILGPVAYASVFAEVFQFVVLAGAGFIVMGRSESARLIYGLGGIAFGSAHLARVAATAQMVPSWMPFGQSFWVIFTGVAFTLAGIAILIGVCDLLATRLLALMLLVFSAFLLLPYLVHAPYEQAAWGSNIYNLDVIGAVWIYAGWLARRKMPQM
jgi:hypothetical protein